MKKGESHDISESTLYPVLRRLQKEGQLATYDSPVQGRNRRYYRITPEGKEKLKFYKKEWKIYKEGIDRLLSGKLNVEFSFSVNINNDKGDKE